MKAQWDEAVGEQDGKQEDQFNQSALVFRKPYPEGYEDGYKRYGPCEDLTGAKSSDLPTLLAAYGGAKD
jgi:hypothetical protein